MSIINALLDLLKKDSTDPKENTPEGVCPNCWGRTEYGGQFFEAVQNHKVDVNDKNPNVGWVQEYANKHLAGIQLKTKDDQLVCQNCKITYRPS